MKDIHPIKPIIQIPIFTNTQITIFWIIICIFFCLLIYNILKKYFWSKKENKKIEPEKINYKSQALKKIKKARKHIELNRLKKFHLDVTDIIKEYASKKYEINFSEMTTKEITSQSKLKIERDKFKNFLKQCDLVKFANEQSKKELAQDIYKTGVEIINKI